MEKKEKLRHKKRRTKTKSAIECFMRYVPSKGFTYVLDLGARTGDSTNLLWKNNYITIGTDIDEECTGKNGVYYDDIMNTELPDGAYHGIFGRHVLEHVEPTEKLLEICHRLLRPKGRVFFIFPLEPEKKFAEDKRHLVRYPDVSDFAKVLYKKPLFNTLYLGLSKHMGVIQFSHKVPEALFVGEKL